MSWEKPLWNLFNQTVDLLVGKSRSLPPRATTMSLLITSASSSASVRVHPRQGTAEIEIKKHLRDKRYYHEASRGRAQEASIARDKKASGQSGACWCKMQDMIVKCLPFLRLAVQASSGRPGLGPWCLRSQSGSQAKEMRAGVMGETACVRPMMEIY